MSGMRAHDACREGQISVARDFHPLLQTASVLSPVLPVYEQEGMRELSSQDTVLSLGRGLEEGMGA